MKLTLENFTENPASFMRQCGYAFEKQAGDEMAFVRRITGHDYPKFHAYIRTEQIANSHTPLAISHKLIINLHIDQKRPSYGNHTAHSGDYDGPLIEEELARIKKLVSKENG